MRLALLALAAACGAVAADGDELAARVLARLAEVPVVRAEFMQERFVASMPAPVLSRGRMTMSRHEGLIWRIVEPVKLTLAFTPTDIIETGADGVRRAGAARRGRAQAEMGRLIRSLTAADAAELRADFELRAEGSLERWKLHLLPRRREMARFLSVVELAGGRYLETIEIHTASGERTVMRMSKFVAATALEPAERDELTPP